MVEKEIARVKLFAVRSKKLVTAWSKRSPGGRKISRGSQKNSMVEKLVAAIENLVRSIMVEKLVAAVENLVRSVLVKKLVAAVKKLVAAVEKLIAAVEKLTAAWSKNLSLRSK